MEEKSYTFKTQKMTFIFKYKFKLQSKKYSLHHQTAVNSVLDVPENRKVYASKHVYECSKGDFKILPAFQTDDYSLLQIKE